MKGRHSDGSDCRSCDYNIWVRKATRDEGQGGASVVDVIWEAECGNQGAACSKADMISPRDARTFHPAELQQATIDINKTLDALNRHKPAGYELSFLRTPMGMMLAWTRHDIKVPANAVNSSSANDAIMHAFGFA